ncbi:tyrosine-type recombinase/integrase [Runella sp. CRIBMP]|uniref:site-specific integrase n=1 Tax=Runella sp. CRIBMP TaxID=2683261 RepID=UPI001411CBB9|nr:site-specific integrase [Runella sp. CRIBMP]NBB18862.1 tyrosine-type recombinase/integrase [Runella sp. CRIBMP]
MDKVTFHYTLDSYVKADGTQSILLRITQNRKHKYIDIGYSVKAAEWNKEKKEVRKSHRLSAEITMVMEAKLIEARQTYLKSKTQDLPITSKEIKRTLKRELVGDSFLDYADNYIKNLANGGTILSRESMLNKLKEHLGKSRDGRQNDLLFPEITYKFLKNYERYLKKIGNGVNTINGNIKFLKTVYKDAINSKHYRTMDNPWLEYNPLPKEKSQRTRLKAFQIEDIENYETKPGSRRHDAKNMFLFAFYLQGMRVKDVLQLKWKQINKNYLYYKASKSKKARPRKIISKALAILEYYRQERTPSDDHVFPFMKGIDEKAYPPTKFVKIIDTKNSQIRNELMFIAGDLGMEKLSMHVARHTWANIARKITGDVHVVSDSLDHSSISVTEGYFGAAEPEENDDLVFKVFGE